MKLQSKNIRLIRTLISLAHVNLTLNFVLRQYNPDEYASKNGYTNFRIYFP
jgi:hypothetical protein